MARINPPAAERTTEVYTQCSEGMRVMPCHLTAGMTSGITVANQRKGTMSALLAVAEVRETTNPIVSIEMLTAKRATARTRRWSQREASPLASRKRASTRVPPIVPPQMKAMKTMNAAIDVSPVTPSYGRTEGIDYLISPSPAGGNAE
jgi:hypothetical protein